MSSVLSPNVYVCFLGHMSKIKPTMAVTSLTSNTELEGPHNYLERISNSVLKISDTRFKRL